MAAASTESTLYDCNECRAYFSTLIGTIRENAKKGYEFRIRDGLLPPYPMILVVGSDDSHCFSNRHLMVNSMLKFAEGNELTSGGVVRINSTYELEQLKEQNYRHCVILLENVSPDDDISNELSSWVHVISCARWLTDRENYVIVSISTKIKKMIENRSQDDIFDDMLKVHFFGEKMTFSKPHNTPRLMTEDLHAKVCGVLSSLRNKKHLPLSRPSGKNNDDLLSKTEKAVLYDIFSLVDQFLVTLLRHSIIRGHIEVVLFLLSFPIFKSQGTVQAKVDVIRVYSWLKNPDTKQKLEEILVSAVKTSQDSLFVENLLHHGANAHYRDHSGNNLLQIMCQQRYVNEQNNNIVNIFSLLVKCGLSLEVLDTEDHNLLHIACSHSNFPLIRWLVANAPKLILRMTWQRADAKSPLLNAVNQGKEVAEILLSASHALLQDDQLVDKVRAEMSELLLAAADKGEQEIVGLLLENGVEISAVDARTGQNALHNACFQGWVNVVAQLLPKMAPLINAEDLLQLTPLEIAIFYEDPKVSREIVRLLLEHGARTQLARNDVFQPLALAAGRRNVEVMSLLIDHGADVGFQDLLGETALHIAAKQNSYEVVRFLMKKGASMFVKNHRGETPFDHFVVD